MPAAPAIDAARALIAVGVSPQVAAGLVAEHGAEQVEQQVAALEHRKPRDRAAVVVKAVREAWSLPAAYVAALDRKRKEQQRAATAAAAAALDAKRAEQRAAAQNALCGLPEGRRAELLDRAALDVQRANPAAWRIMRAAARDALVRNRALALLAVDLGQEVAA